MLCGLVKRGGKKLEGGFVSELGHVARARFPSRVMSSPDGFEKRISCISCETETTGAAKVPLEKGAD
jgi:hypothetical protein